MSQQTAPRTKMSLFDSAMVNMRGVENPMWSCSFAFGLLDKGQKPTNGLGLAHFGTSPNHSLQSFIVVFK